MTYIADPANPALPLDSDDVSGGAAELRALKQYLQGLISGGTPIQGYAYQGFRNKVLNGNYDIWQDVTSLANGVGKRYYADGHYVESIGTTCSEAQTAFTVGQTVVPHSPTFYDQITVVSSAGAANYALKSIPIEGVKDTAGKVMSYGFWAFSDAARNIAVEFTQSFGTGGSPSAGVTGIGSQLKALTTGWQFISVQATMPGLTGKTFGTNGDDVLNINIWMDAGSNFNVRAANLGQQSGTFRFAQHQFEISAAPTPFELRPLDFETDWALRYFKVQRGTTTTPFGVGQNFSTTDAKIGMAYKRMWKNPTLSFSAASDFALTNNVFTNIAVTALSVFSVTRDFMCLSASVASGVVAGNATMLLANSANCVLRLDARM